MRWTVENEEFFRENYSRIGKTACAIALNKTLHQVRAKASRLGLRLDHSSEFCREWQERAAKNKIGKKRPNTSETLKRLFAEGNRGSGGV